MEAGIEHGGSLVGAEMSGERILIVDDRRENLIFLANSVLRPEGYEVLTAMDGKQGLDKALDQRPDLIITDLKMPRLSGLELIAALKKEQIYIPVILTTFYGSEQAAIQAFRLGAKDYIIKPYDVGEMLESVERALIEKRLRRETMNLKEGAEVTRHLEERVRQLHSLCGIGKAVTALHDPNEVMRVVVEASLYVTSANSGQLFLVNSQTNQIELRAIRGPSDSRARCVQQPGADQATLQAAQNGKTIVSEQGGGGRDKTPRLATPMRSGNRVLGVLAVDAKPAYSFNENDRYLMGLLADFATVGVTNAQMIEELKTQAAVSAEMVREAPGAGSRPTPTSDLADSIAEAERMSRELRNLASMAQMLAAKLQVQSESG
jgi:two-component system NtrC family sensor kinase